MKNERRHSWPYTLMCASLFSLTLGTNVGCTEEIDDSNFAIKTEMTIADYVSNDEDLSMIESLFKSVKLGNSEGASSLYNVLTTRGNYTLFLPTNASIQQYLSENGFNSIDELSRF